MMFCLLVRNLHTPARRPKWCTYQAAPLSGAVAAALAYEMLFKGRHGEVTRQHSAACSGAPGDPRGGVTHKESAATRLPVIRDTSHTDTSPISSRLFAHTNCGVCFNVFILPG